MSAIDYDAWAKRYDGTRGASPSVLRALLDALGPPAGRSLLDIGGGTGNYARALRDAGFRVTLCDFSPGMAAQAAAKLDGSAVAIADGQHLPFSDGSFDCAISVKVLNHVPDWRRFLREARRVVRNGPLVLLHATKETLEGNWILEYLPSLVAPENTRYETQADILEALREAGFGRAEVKPMFYSDLEDGSAQALKHDPDAFLANVRNTSLFYRLSSDEADALLERIRADHQSGRLREVMERYEPLVTRYGDGPVFSAWA
jgi:ubiquinone/menaquinone biosynthesis C-methylase UbiE